MIIKINYFGQVSASDFTIHNDEQRKQRYINRHKTNENRPKSGIDTAGFLSRWLLWNKPTIKQSYIWIHSFESILRVEKEDSILNMYIN
jgi:hypothetical protein